MLFAITANSQDISFYDGEIYSGLKGYAITEISQGNKEIIDIEVIGKTGRGSISQSFVLVRLSGETIERYGIAAGMSGSPVYIDDKLLGALSFTYSFQRENIAGVTLISDTIQQTDSIESMDLFQIDNIDIKSLNEELIFQYNAEREQGIYMPVRGIFEKQGGIIPNDIPFSAIPVDIPMSGSNRHDLKYDHESIVEPGDTFGMLLMKGDMDITAYGTITYIDQENYIAYALGHQAFSLGSYNIPITKARTVYTVPSDNISFKIAENYSIIGSMLSESNSGIKISLTKEPEFIPIEITLKAQDNENTYNFDMAKFDLAIPSLFQNASFASLQNFAGTYNIRSIDAQIQFSGNEEETLLFRNIYNGYASFPQFITETSNLLSILLFNEYKRYELENLKLKLNIKREIEKFSLINCSVSTNKPKQGEEIDINMVLSSNRGNTVSKTSKIKIPDYYPDSKAMLIIADHNHFILFETMRNRRRFSPRNYDDIIRLIKEYPSSNNIYILLYSFSPSYSIDGYEMKNLPLFYDSMMSLDQSLVNQQSFSLENLLIIENDFSVSGGQIFPLEISYK